MVKKYGNFSKFVMIPIITIYAGLSLFPMLWMLLLSLKPGTSVISVPPDLSLAGLTLANFKALFANSMVLKWGLNSLIIAGTLTLTNVIFSSMAGYAFAKKEFKGKKLLFTLVMAIMMISNQIIMIPLFILISDMNLINNYLGLLLPGLVSPLYVFLATQFIKGIHNELLLSAKVDGCNEWNIYRMIILPISMPALAIIAIFSFITHWNDFLWPMIVTNSKSMRTLPVGLASLQQMDKADYGFLMAGSVFATVPIVILFISCNKYFIRGLTVGSVKG